MSKHFYIEYKGLKPESVKLLMGEVVMGDNFLNKKVVDPNVKTTREFIDKYIPDHSKVILLVHGMWGNITIAWNDMLNRLQPSLKDLQQHEKTIIVSLIWDCTPIYKKNVEIASWKGGLAAHVLSELSIKKPTELDILSHSMGNRFFQHILLNSKKNKSVHIHKWLLMAADLEPEVFEKSLHPFLDMIDEINVFIHQNDRTLQVSEFLNKSKRIGITGPTSKIEKVKTIDVTDLKDNDDIATNYINHRYFYTSPTVRKMIIDILSD